MFCSFLNPKDDFVLVMEMLCENGFVSRQNDCSLILSVLLLMKIQAFLFMRMFLNISLLRSFRELIYFVSVMEMLCENGFVGRQNDCSSILSFPLLMKI